MYLMLEVNASQIPVSYPRNSTQDTLTSLCIPLRGYHTFSRSFPGDFEFAV